MMEKKIIDVIQAFANNKKIMIVRKTPLTDIIESSIEFINLVVVLEENFDFEFDDEKLLFEAYETIDDLIQYIVIKTGENNES